MFDYYRALRVDRLAGTQDIEAAYHREIAVLTAARFTWWTFFRRALVQSAYETLSDADRRRVYNAHLEVFGGSFPQPPV